MKPYFFYVRRDDRSASDLHIMMFENDGQAREEAAVLLGEQPQRVHVEVWDGDRAVGEVDRPGVPPQGL